MAPNSEQDLTGSDPGAGLHMYASSPKCFHLSVSDPGDHPATQVQTDIESTHKVVPERQVLAIANQRRTVSGHHAHLLGNGGLAKGEPRQGGENSKAHSCHVTLLGRTNRTSGFARGGRRQGVVVGKWNSEYGRKGMFYLFALAYMTAAALQPGTAQSGGERWKTDEYGRTAVAFADAGAGPAGGSKAAAKVDGWEALGPYGGDVQDMGSSPTAPQVVLAGVAPNGGTGGTLFRSTDQGQTWSEVSALDGTSVYDIEFASDGTAWIGTINSVWTSTDDGVSWTQFNLGIGANDQVFEVTLDPAMPLTLWAGVGAALGGQPRTVMRSTNGGLTWQDKTPPMGSAMSCTGIAIHPSDSSRIYCTFRGSFSGSAVWVSQDGGQSWVNRSAGLPTSSQANGAAHDGTRAIVWGGHLFGGQDFGVFASTDEGVTWAALHDASWPNLAVNCVEFGATSAVLYASTSGGGINTSTDAGATWTVGLSGTGSLSVNGIHVSPGSGTPVWAGCSSVAVIRSMNGTAFAPSANGIGALDAESVAVSPLDPGQIAVAFQGLNDGGIYASSDGGSTWSLQALPATRFNTVGFAPDGRLYAISDGPSTIGQEALYRRDGTTWTALGPDQGTAFESELFALTFSEQDPSLIMLGGSDFGVAGFEATVWRSGDSGTSWTKAYEGSATYEDVQQIVILADGTDQRMVAAFSDLGQAQTGGALRSIDGGHTWMDASTGLPVNANAMSLSAWAWDPDTVFLADDAFTGGGLFKSVDGGATWNSTGYQGRLRRVVTDPVHPQRLYGARWSSPIAQVSNDGGATFTPLDTGLGAAGHAQGLVLHPQDCSRLLLSTTSGAWVEEVSCGLQTSGSSLSLGAGGTMDLVLAAGPEHAGRTFVVLGSASGTAPGIPMGGDTIPLNYDPYMYLTIVYANAGPFFSTLGVLDAQGLASAQISLPPGSPPELAGLVLHHAFGVLDVPLAVLEASNAQPLDLLP